MCPLQLSRVFYHQHRRPVYNVVCIQLPPSFIPTDKEVLTCKDGIDCPASVAELVCMEREGEGGRERDTGGERGGEREGGREGEKVREGGGEREREGERGGERERKRERERERSISIWGVLCTISAASVGCDRLYVGCDPVCRS